MADTLAPCHEGHRRCAVLARIHSVMAGATGPKHRLVWSDELIGRDLDGCDAAPGSNCTAGEPVSSVQSTATPLPS